MHGFFIDRNIMKIILVISCILIQAIVGCGPKNEGRTPLGVKFEVLKHGTGAAVKQGNVVNVHYTGWLVDGTKFDSSVDRNEPFSFRVGGGEVIQGWDEALLTMKVGGKSKFTIPPELGYGQRGAGGIIPPNATLIFEIELLSIK
jgi:FKBP-type peptidyl-prolyl cis-trans isomerase